MSEAQSNAEEKRKARFGAAAGVLPPRVLPSRVLPWLQPDVRPGELAQRLLAALKAAALSEIETRRLFLWVPVAAGAGVVLYFVADREPALWLTGSLAGAAALSAWFARRHFAVFALCVAIAALFAGLFSAGWRTARVAAPVLDRIRIATLTGYIEQVDLRREGARLVMRIDRAEGLAPEITPYRVRLTTRREPGLEAGSFVSLKARLLPPAHAALPGGYDFARDAYYMRIGAVGSVLGKMQAVAPPDHPGLFASLHMSIDRARNALARRVASSVEGDAGAIAVAMVTGKRDFLSEDAKDLVREAGIFHIITISGVQMTLVAGILFFMARLALTLLPGFALRYPIKKWAAGFAILGAIAYDIMTGSRVGTERALFMTMIMLGAIIAGRPAITMRNLGLAALVVIILEPEAIMGASFQLSFAAVSALVAVYETRIAARMKAIAANAGGTNWQAQRSSLIFDPVGAFLRLGHWAREAGIATLCATSATASFMAYDFHELSPYVLIGNPLTLALIEFFAVPGALLGAVLYPLGLDGPVWAYVGLGIRLVLEVARWIAAAPGATVHLRDFAPWSIAFLSMAVLCMVIWRSWIMRITAVPFAALGLIGAMSGERFDIVVPPGADSVAVRAPDGRLTLIGKKPNSFSAEQWLRADADGRKPAAALGGLCDRLACIASLPDGRTLSLIHDRQAFAEDCKRAAIIVTSEYVPAYCEARLIVSRKNLVAAGAIAIKLDGDRITLRTARSSTEDRPWSPLKARASQDWPGERRVLAPAPEQRTEPPADEPDDGDGW